MSISSSWLPCRVFGTSVSGFTLHAIGSSTRGLSIVVRDLLQSLSLFRRPFRIPSSGAVLLGAL